MLIFFNQLGQQTETQDDGSLGCHFSLLSAFPGISNCTWSFKWFGQHYFFQPLYFHSSS